MLLSWIKRLLGLLPTAEDPGAGILNNNDLNNLFLFMQESPRHLVCDSIDYEMPTKNWLLTTFANYYKTHLLKDGIKGYGYRWSCGHYAWYYYIQAQMLHAEETKALGMSLAVGTVRYTKNADFPNQTGHFINVAIVENKEIIYIEPQSGEIVLLTPAEHATIAFIYF